MLFAWGKGSGGNCMSISNSITCLFVWNGRVCFSHDGLFGLCHPFRYRGKLAKASEQVTDSFVDNTLTIMTRAIMIYPDVKEELEAVEDQFFPGPLSAIQKLLAVVQKATSAPVIPWCFFSIFDMTRSGALPQE